MAKLKPILGTIAIIAIILEGFELYFQPTFLVTEKSSSPEMLSWLRWIVALVSVTGYFLLDLLGNKK